jgi:teichuronic acid biosynthesis glycosyltransferase TuaG
MTGAATPLVSIVTPAFRAERFVGETIRSAQAQTCPDFEMLVVDDCSPDGTASVVAAIAEHDARIRLLRHERNGGPAAARNTALAAARGRFIAFLDGDDLWLPEKLERQVQFMAATRAAVSYTGYRRIDAAGRPVSPVIPVPLRLTYRGLLKNTAMVTSTVMVDREQTGPFAMRRIYTHDYVLWLELLKRGFTGYGLREELTKYRVVSASFSRNKLRQAVEVWRTYRRVEGLGIASSAWVFAHYAWHAFWKYRR